jgi:hypothetical protein
MTGWKGGFVTLMDKESTNEVLRVWCPAHQMDLVIQDATVMISDNAFTKTAHSFTVHLRQQANASPPTSQFIARDGQQLPKGHESLGTLPRPIAVAVDTPH